MRQCETQMITRRFFIAGAVSFGAFHGLRAFAAPSDFGLRRRGNLRFGVISDIHVALSLKDGVTPNGMPRIVEDAFRCFRDQGVDAVVIPGISPRLARLPCDSTHPRPTTIRVEKVPPQVFVEYKRLPSVPVRGAKVVTASGVSDVPDFGLYRFAVERNAVFNGEGR